MKLRNLVFSAAFLIALLPSFILAEDATEKWVKTYRGGYAADIAVDSSGSVYVTGGNYGYVTTKHDTDGNELWAKDYSKGSYGVRATALAIDSSGNAYVTGMAGESSVTIKYDTNGNEKWVKAENYCRGYLYYASLNPTLAVDLSGNVYVTAWGCGVYDPYNPNMDYVIIKYDTDGNELWTKRYDGGYRDYVSGLTVDSSGNVYVTGASCSYPYECYSDYVTVKYDTNGNELWVKRYDSGSQWDSPTAIAIDSSGNAYIAGNNFWGDYLTIKYDTDGNELWNKRYRGYNMHATALAVDMSGNVYVTGYDWTSDANIDYVTVKYDTNGNELWVKRYDSGWATALTVDLSGNVYVTGESSSDYLTIKYDTNGNELWIKRYDSCGSDHAAAIAIDSLNNIYVTGSYVTIKYSQADIPHAPANLTATAISPWQINLSWTDNSNDEDGFKVMRATISGGPYSLITTTPANSTTYQDTGLSPEKTYYYKVKAFNANGDSDYANVAGSSGCNTSEVSATTLRADTDGDGILDEYDKCPLENPQGKDANQDGCIDKVCDLSNLVESSAIDNQGIKTSLTQKAENACKLYEAGNTTASKNLLDAFIKEAEAQKGKQIVSTIADTLITFATNAMSGM